MDGCIAVHSNDFLYNVKANWNSKNHFCLKKQRGDFLGRFELFSWNFNITKNVRGKNSITARSGRSIRRLKQGGCISRVYYVEQTAGQLYEDWLSQVQHGQQHSFGNVCRHHPDFSERHNLWKADFFVQLGLACLGPGRP